MSDYTLREISITSNSERTKMAEFVIRRRAQLAAYNENFIVLSRLLDKMGMAQAEVSDGHQKSGEITTLDEKENFSEATGVETYVATSGRSRNAPTGQLNLLSLDDFFSRPVELYKAQLPISTYNAFTLRVWDLYSLLAPVRAKWRNYAYFRGDLHIRISISGTPFHAGLMLISYQPYADFNQNLKTINDGISAGYALGEGLYTYLSSTEGSALININENKPVDIICPFISTKPMHRLYNTDSTAVIGSGTSYNDFYSAGTLYIETLVPISSVSASPSTVYMQVYAHMENVELGTTTGTQIAIATEADEREIGPVERIATRAMDVSSALASVPVLEPYATASEMFFGAIAKIASIFGWSKPVIINEPIYTRPQPFTNGALTIGYDQSDRIVLDPKQELTVDPRVCGRDADDMIISEIAARFSYIGKFTWSHTATPLSTQLWSQTVTPNIGRWITHLALNYIVPSNMAFAVQPFTFWRGDVVFRFHVVCSAFHRGKLAIYYEPNSAQHSLISSSISLNKQFIKVIDIQETQVFELRVNWGAARPWLLVGNAGLLATWSDPANIANSIGFGNGYIGVVCFTELQSPDNSDVTVSVFAKCENLAVNGLTQNNMPTQRGIAEVETCIESEPVTTVDLNLSSASYDGLCEDYFGEQPLSFRALLKRFVFNQEIDIPADATSAYKVLTGIAPILPQNLLPFNTASDVSYMDLFSYLRYAYLGIRGSVRARIQFGIIPTSSYVSSSKVGLMPPTTVSTSSASFNVAIRAPNYATLEGAQSYKVSMNSGLSAEFPYYSNNLFQLCFSDTYEDDAVVAADKMCYTYYRNFFFTIDTEANVEQCPIVIERAAGEDFNLIRYMGPVLYTALPPS